MAVPECLPLMVIDQNDLHAALVASGEVLGITFAAIGFAFGLGAYALGEVITVIAKHVRTRSAARPFADRAAHYRRAKAKHVALLTRISARVQREASRAST